MKIVNLTPHDIVVGDVTIPASGTIARCATITEPLDVPGCPVPVVRQYFGAVEGLPAPAPETMYVVSMVCAQAVGDSRDFAAKYDLQVSTVERLIRGDRFTPEEAREVNMKIYDKLVDNLFSCRLDS